MSDRTLDHDPTGMYPRYVPAKIDFANGRTLFVADHNMNDGYVNFRTFSGRIGKVPFDRVSTVWSLETETFHEGGETKGDRKQRVADSDVINAILEANPVDNSGTGSTTQVGP